MNVCIVHVGNCWESLVATSLLRGLRSEYGSCDVDWVTNDENISLIQYNKYINSINIREIVMGNKYDLLINISPNMDACQVALEVVAAKKMGFLEKNAKVVFCSSSAKHYYEATVENQKTNKTIFQMLFSMAGLKWRGEGCVLSYYPRTRSKKYRTGIAVRDTRLRNFIKSNLSLSYSDAWHVPMRKNLLKRMDEINRCKRIITDDLFTAHAAIALKKYVEFLDTRGLSMRFEFFGKGKTLDVSEYVARHL